MSRKGVLGLVEKVGASVNEFFRWVGGVARMFGRALWVGPRRPFGIYDISYQTLAIGLRSMPMATLMSLFVGMILAWQFGEAMAYFGATQAIGYASALALVRELVPSLMAVTVGSKMATGMTAELGSMKVTEQIDAIASLGADPIKKLVWPRLVASTLSMPLLVVWGNAMALLGGMFISDTVFNVPAGYFYTTYVTELVPLDYISGLTKATVFGAIAGIIGCYQGFNTKFGTEAVGLATTETVVAVSIAVIVADFLLTTVFLPV